VLAGITSGSPKAVKESRAFWFHKEGQRGNHLMFKRE
jgi:hypothetical protein